MIRQFTISLHNVDLALSSKAVAGHPRLFDKPLNFDVHVGRPLDTDYANRLVHEWDVTLPITVACDLGPLSLRVTHAMYTAIRHIVDDNFLTTRHHAEDALKALRAVDLQPLVCRRTNAGNNGEIGM